jgi:ribosomal protein S3
MLDFSWKTKDEKKSALFIVEQIVYFFYKRVPFHRIKQQIWRQLKLKSIQGIRITYSGRLEVALRKHNVRDENFSMGSSIISCFESKMSFASQYALTIFGKLELKFGFAIIGIMRCRL